MICFVLVILLTLVTAVTYTVDLPPNKIYLVENGAKHRFQKSYRESENNHHTVTTIEVIKICFAFQVNFALVSEAFSIAKLGIVINSSVNFYLYCLSAKRFRDELWTMLCRGRYADRELLSSSMRDTSSSVISRSKASVKKSMSSV